MKILQVHTRYRDPGGEDAVVAAERALLESAGHTVVQHLGDNPDRALAATSALLAAPWNPRQARAAAAAVLRHRPDVVHVHNTWFAMSPAVVAAIADTGVPVVMTLHNYRLVCIQGMLTRDDRLCTDCVGGPPSPGVRHACYRGSTLQSTVAAATVALHRRLDTWSGVSRFVVMTQADRDLYVTGGLDPRQLTVKPHFVVDRGARPEPPSRSRVVMFVGRLTASKGIVALMDAWDRARPTHVQLHVYGDGDDAPSPGRLPDGVVLHGWQSVDTISTAMRDARVLVANSRHREPFGLTRVEGMAAGVPVVAGDVPGVREILPPSHDEVIVDPDDTAALAVVLGRLADDDDLVDRLGSDGRMTYLDRFSPLQGLRELEQLYTDAIRGTA